MSRTAMGLLLVHLSAAHQAAGQTMWHVNGEDCLAGGDGTAEAPFCLIQEGIDAAEPGDVVQVSPGLYIENLVIDKAIDVRSENPYDQLTVEATIVDGDELGTVVTLTNGVIRGFTIRGGLLDEGLSGGGGVTASGMAMVLQNVIADNLSLGQGAGGIDARDDVLVARNLITLNDAIDSAGGVTAFDKARVLFNFISDNFGNGGGGIFAADTATVMSNHVSANLSDSVGGGLYAAGAASIRNNFIYDNQALGLGGGGGVYAVDASMVQQNTIVGNELPFEFDGAGARLDGAVVFTGNIIAFNRTMIPDLGFGGVFGSGSLSDFNCVFGNDAQQYGGSLGRGANDIEDEPRFVQFESAARDLHLQPMSPCIDRGDPQYSLISGERDVDGGPRLLGSRVDIGADEFTDSTGLESPKAVGRWVRYRAD